MKRYYGSFKNEDDLCQEFYLDANELDGLEILYACYEAYDWEGSAHVIFRKDGKLFEVNSSHCSCDGLSWQPEETTLKALLARPNVAEEAKEILKAL